ncbi:MAG: M28 family peptidase, partial [Thermoanaerobaculia bacterium]
DGEELGLLGALGFAAEHPWMEEVVWVLNFEARGSRGPVAMFETGHGDLDLVRAFADAAPHPLASSLSAEVYARMLNDTDFTAFRSHGLSGLNFAFLGGLDAYHTALDTAERLDPASLQHAGANAVALIRKLDGGGGERQRRGGVWFNPLGGWLLVVPAGVVLPLAGALAMATLVVALLGARSRRVDCRALGSSLGLGLAALVLAALAGAVLWRLFADNAAGVLDTPHELPHRLELTGVALLLAGLAAVAALGALTRRPGPNEVALGVALPLAALALLAAVFLPGVSFLFWWPLWGLLAAIIVVAVVDAERPLAILVLALGALPGVVLLAPLAVLVYQAITPRLATAAMTPAALLVALALPAVVAATGGRQGLALAALVASVATLTGSVWGAADAARPRTTDLMHLEELDTGNAFWLSRDELPHVWTIEQMGGEPQTWEAPSLLGFLDRPLLRGGVAPASAAGPEVIEIEDVRLDGRRLTVRVGSPDGAPMLRIEAASSVQITAVELAGQRFERAGDEATRPLRLELAGFPAEGLEVSFQLPDRWPLELHVTEQFYGLPAAPALPPGLIPDSSWTSHSRLVHRSYLR